MSVCYIKCKRLTRQFQYINSRESSLIYDNDYGIYISFYIHNTENQNFYKVCKSSRAFRRFLRKNTNFVPSNCVFTLFALSTYYFRSTAYGKIK